MYDNGEMMGGKINLLLSIGALFPFFIFSLIVSVLTLKSIIFLIPSITLFSISILINLYAIKFMNDKKQFNPMPIKILTLDKKSTVGNFFTIISLILSMIPIYFSTYSITRIDIVVIFFAVTILLIIIYALFEKENSISQVLSLRLLFYHFYIARTDNKSKIYLFSKEKLQEDRKIKAYHVLDDVYIFGYLTNN